MTTSLFSAPVDSFQLRELSICVIFELIPYIYNTWHMELFLFLFADYF